MALLREKLGSAKSSAGSAFGKKVAHFMFSLLSPCYKKKSGVRKNLFRFEMFGLFAVEGSASNSVTTSVYFAKLLLDEWIWGFSFFCDCISRSEETVSN